jgi:hypothetical protein
MKKDASAGRVLIKLLAFEESGGCANRAALSGLADRRIQGPLAVFRLSAFFNSSKASPSSAFASSSWMCRFWAEWRRLSRRWAAARA